MSHHNIGTQTGANRQMTDTTTAFDDEFSPASSLERLKRYFLFAMFSSPKSLFQAAWNGVQ